jgi:quinoprotein glucose dehydrogenase
MVPRRSRPLGSSLAILVAVVAVASGRLSGQAGAPTREWRTWGGELANTKYSPLDQINKDNFNKLEVAWRFKTDALGPRPEFNYETTPLMANGVIYATAGTRRSVVALDAATGELLWMHREDEGARGDAAPRKLSGRGLAYWSDAKEQRVIYVTPGCRLVALDAKTGIPVPGFGTSGIVDLKLDDDQEMDLVTGEVGLHAAPTVAKDLIIVGAAHLPGGVPRSRRNEKGYVRIRRAHRQAPVDFPHDSAAGRIWQQHLGKGLVVIHRERRRVGADHGRRGARHRLPSGGVADR